MSFLSFLLSRASHTWPHTFALPLLPWRLLSPRLFPTLWQGRSQARWGAAHKNRSVGRLQMLQVVVPREELWFCIRREGRWGPVFAGVTAQKRTKAKRKTPTLHGWFYTVWWKQLESRLNSSYLSGFPLIPSLFQSVYRWREGICINSSLVLSHSPTFCM